MIEEKAFLVSKHTRYEHYHILVQKNLKLYGPCLTAQIRYDASQAGKYQNDNLEGVY